MISEVDAYSYEAELGAEKSASKNARDEQRLEDIGYRQDLKRTFGLLSMIGFCFSILSCWTAIAGSLAESMLNGGPVALVFGWIGCCAFSFCVALAMADVCSAYPVSGGQYSWCLLLGQGARWGRVVSYICGWIQLAGIVCMAASAIYQFGLLCGAMGVVNTDNRFQPTGWEIVLFSYAVGIANTLVAVFGNQLIHYLSSGILYWSVGGFIICTVVILVRAPHLQSPKFVFTDALHDSGWGLGMSIILGCMQSAYSIATFDAPAHLSEELNNASRDAPRAIVLSVIIGFITGLGFILAMLFSVQDINGIVNTPTGFPVVEIFRQAANSKAGAMCLSSIVLVCSYMSCQSLLVESSRSIYAFARDGGFPWKLNEWLVVVDPRLDVPVLAVLLSMAFQMAFVAIRFGSEAAFTTVLNISSAGLYVSYLMPIVVALIRYKHKAEGYYNLGKWAIIVQIPAIIYLVFCSIFFFFPTNLPVDGNNMNYCCVAFGIDALFGLISWYGGARKTYATDSAAGENIISGIVIEEEPDAQTKLNNEKEGAK